LTPASDDQDRALVQALMGFSARLGGEPIWIQEEGGGEGLVLQFDESFDINAGGGVVYAFADTVYWQS
jgi:hypothetical protein